MNREVHVRFWESAGLRCPALLAYLNAYATVAEAKAGIGAWSASTRASAIARRGKFTRKACGYVDDRLCRPAPLPPPPEPARKAGKCSPSPTYPQAPQPTKDLILIG